jgi:D-apionolactonase
LEEATRQANELVLKLEVALLISSQMKKELAKLRLIINTIRPPVCSWLCYADKEWMENSVSVSDVLPTARATLADYDPSIPFCGGTNSDFIFFKGSIPPLDQIQKICFAINPQSHTFDNASLVETLEIQGSAVINARHIAKGLPVVVTPITLKPRFNPYATGAASKIPTNAIPEQVDVRQMSLLGASWTMGSVKYLAEAGVDSVTYYETSGWRGVMEINQVPSRPEGFHFSPGCVFPLYHVLTDICEFNGGWILPVRTSHPLIVNGLLLRKRKQERMILANYSIKTQRVSLHNLSPTQTFRSLDETNFMQAIRSPLKYRREAEFPFKINDGSLEIDILPYAIIKIDSK